MQNSTAKNYSIPDFLRQNIEQALVGLGSSLQKSSHLAQAVMKLSDFFIQNPEQKTPWNNTGTAIAYLSYYTPLNYLRACRVVEKAQEVLFFNDLNHVIEFGSGLGSATLALQNLAEIKSFDFIETSEVAQKIHQQLLQNKPQENKKWHRLFHNSLRTDAKTLAVFSYSLTELPTLPQWATQCEAVMILEPSTQQDGRNLMELRHKLIEKGFFIWAPCTHQNFCPLLNESKTDWCHDRLHIAQQDWQKELEQHLPMKNRTLTVSYLLARKTPPPPFAKGTARLVGDQLDEKGKVRQMVCRGPQREYLAWLKKIGPAPELFRGELFAIAENSELKGNEIRPS